MYNVYKSAQWVFCCISLQSLCCVDNKSVLSWPNPTPEKVFFLRNDIEPFDASKPGSSYVSAESIDHIDGGSDADAFDEKSNMSLKNFRLESGSYNNDHFYVHVFVIYIT